MPCMFGFQAEDNAREKGAFHFLKVNFLGGISPETGDCLFEKMEGSYLVSR